MAQVNVALNIGGRLSDEMVKPAKLYDQLLQNQSRILSFRDFEQLLKSFGFELHGQRGSHRSYKHAQAQRMIVVQPRGSDAKGYQVRQFLDMIQEYGLTIGEQ